MTVRIAAPSIEHHRGALGIGESAPRLSWIIEDAPAGWAQPAYEVEIDRGGHRDERRRFARSGAGGLAGSTAAVA